MVRSSRMKSKRRRIESKAARSSQPFEIPMIVGVGASAGGLEALRSLVGNLKKIDTASLVIVQHLSPQHRSMLVDLISRETSLIVKEVRSGAVPEPNVIYITPPNADIIFQGGALVLRKPASSTGPKPSVNLFLESLADEIGDKAVGVILSGTGNDGARGIRAIKAAGGLTMAQDTNSAKYDGMPSAAIESGTVDIVDHPENLARELNQLSRHQLYVSAENSRTSNDKEDPYRSILYKLKLDSGVDFTMYKPNTVRRRLQRRMLSNRTETLEEYLRLIEKKPKELLALYQDILISVTCFFRDPSAYQHVEKQIIKYLKSSVDSSGLFRVWIPGCATGEEVYSLAMMLIEIFNKLNIERKLQIFATDISEPALSAARKAIYPEQAVLKMPKGLKQKYLDHIDDDSYQVKKFVRDSVIFAKQDLLKDPPFLKLDLISCRNVFIYFNQEAQDKIFRVFHYALNPGGVLFLGKSESVGKHERLFKTINQRSRIFCRSRTAALTPLLMRSHKTNMDSKGRDRGERRTSPSSPLDLIPQLAPHSVIVDESLNLKKIYGSMRELLTFSQGELSHSLLKLLPENMKIEVTNLVHRSRKEKRRVVSWPREVRLGKKRRILQLSALPLKVDGGLDFLIEILRDEPAAKKAPHVRTKSSIDPSRRIQQLEQELSAAKAHLQTTVEELETSNEELQALNEELQSANEELQSANEELETSNEELHSTNEELTTLNEELNVKSAEMAALNIYLENIQNSIQQPLFVVDQNMQLVRSNTACTILFKPEDAVKVRNIRLLPTRYDLTEAFDVIENCVKGGVPHTAKRIVAGDKIFDLIVRTLKTDIEGANGAVILLVDMTDYMRALKSSEDNEKMLHAILRNLPAPVNLKDPSGRYTFVNDQFCDVFGIKKGDIIGKTDEEIFDESRASTVREQDFKAISNRSSVRFEEQVEINGKTMTFFTAKVPLLDSENAPRSVCTISLDMSEKKLAEETVQAQQEQLLRISKLSALGEMATGIAHEINTPLNAIIGNTDLLELLADKGKLNHQEVLQCAKDINTLVEAISKIIMGLRNLARMDSNGHFVRRSLQTMIRETVQVCQMNLRNHGVKVELKLPDKPIEIDCHPVQISQVLINLINNSVDAISKKTNRWICISAIDKGNMVEILQSDCGDGIPDEIADKIMTPFFTTKEAGRGTGMGLSISQSIIGLHHGKLFLDRSNDNTCFVIQLPKMQPSETMSERRYM